MAVLLAHQAVTHPTTVVGDSLDVTRMEWLTVDLYHAFNEAAANTNAGSFYVQRSQKSSGNDWASTPFTSFSGTPASEAFSATEPAGETTIAVASTTGLTVDSLVYLRDATLANSEWARIRQVVTNTSVTLVDGLEFEHAATTTSIFTDAEIFSTVFDVRGAERLRVVYVHEGSTGANVHIKALSRGFDD